MRPFVFINIAASADGKISNESRQQIRISCREDMERVDKLRASSDAIMVGIGTVLSDNPKLTVKSSILREQRIKNGLNPNPMRVVVDGRCRIPPDAEVLNEEAKTIVAVSELANPERVDKIKKRAEVLVSGKTKVNLKTVVKELYNRGIRRLMVEGGGTLNQGLLQEGLVDEIVMYYGNLIIGGKNSPTPVDGRSFSPVLELELIELERVGNGLVARWKIV
jgi:2,5-diamino-6-(ribosylamino)-4(3H)-pyrimidinone 5'-phosphate reductase